MQRRVRHWLIGAAILVVIGLELGLGAFRQETAIREAVEASLGRAGRTLEREAAELRKQLQNAREHALYCAEIPRVKQLCETEPRSQADRDAHAYAEVDLDAFLHRYSVFLRVQLVDTRGFVRCRLERIGAMGGSLGVASLPWQSLGQIEPPAPIEQPGEVRVVGMRRDDQRIDLAERNRQVIRFEAGIHKESRYLGTITLDFFAVPLLERARESVTLPGGVAYLIDRAGRQIASSEGAGASLSWPIAQRIVEGGIDQVTDGEDTYLAASLETDPGWILVHELPRDTLIGTAELLGAEFRRTMLMIGITIVILIVIGVFTIRLSARESQYRSLLEGVGDALLIVDPESGRILETNRAARDLLSEGPGSTELSALVPEDRRAELESAIAHCRSGESMDLHDWRLAEAWGERPVDIRLVPVELAAGQRLEVGLRDLRDRRALEMRLRHAERLSDLGRLTAGVAHEINNPLEGIGNYLALLERSGDDLTKRGRYLEMVRHGFDRVRTIVRDLLSFAQTRTTRNEPLDLDVVLESVERIARFDRGLKGTRIVHEFEESLPPISGDRVGLEQVFLNLILNAGQAMKGQGELTIRVQRVSEGRLEVRFEDTGPGIPEADLERLFDPFFTTRPEGTGLGLSISFGIIGAHGGEIRAANRPGGGAVFTVGLPLTRANQTGTQLERGVNEAG
ncbi:MAG: ATP-binding protein [Planctomycetota bacterium]